MKKQLRDDKKNSNPAHTKMQNIIARTIIIGVVLSVTVMVVAMAIYLYNHNGPAPIKHIFNGEPKQLEKNDAHHSSRTIWKYIISFTDRGRLTFSQSHYPYRHDFIRFYH